jgi:hypothetical protein
MNTGSAIELALRCYPGWWRERYGDEVRVVSQELTAEGRSTMRVTLNLLGGAFQARSRAQGMPKHYGLWSVRTRTSVAAATLPWLLIAPFLLASIGNVSFHSSKGPISWSGFSPMPSHLQIISHAVATPAPLLAPVGRLVMYSSLALTVLFLVTFAVLISGWSGLTSAIKRSTVAHRRRLRLLAWAPVFALLVDVVLVITQAKMRPSSFTFHQNHVVGSGGDPTILHILNYAVPTVAIVGWLASIACVGIAARQADVAPTDLRFGKSVAVVVSLLFALFVAAYATWGIGLIVQARQAANGNFTTIAYLHSGLWLPMMLLLLAAVALSVMSARAARSSWKVISTSFI